MLLLLEPKPKSNKFCCWLLVLGMGLLLKLLFALLAGAPKSNRFTFAFAFAFVLFVGLLLLLLLGFGFTFSLIALLLTPLPNKFSLKPEFCSAAAAAFFFFSFLLLLLLPFPSSSNSKSHSSFFWLLTFALLLPPAVFVSSKSKLLSKKFALLLVLALLLELLALAEAVLPNPPKKPKLLPFPSEPFFAKVFEFTDSKLLLFELLWPSLFPKFPDSLPALFPYLYLPSFSSFIKCEYSKLSIFKS